MKHQWSQSAPEMLPTRELQRIDNRIKPRAVTGWTLRGGSYRNGRRIPGCTMLQLTGGGYLYYSEDVSLKDALIDAKDRGFDTQEVQLQVQTWIATGTGAKFSLE